MRRFFRYVLGYAALSVIMFAGLLIYNRIFETFIWPHFQGELDTTPIVRPSGRPVFVRASAAVDILKSTDERTVVARVEPRGVVYRQHTVGEWSFVALYGWVWRTSLSKGAGSARQLVPTLQQENMRSRSQGAVIGQFLPSAQLESLAMGVDNRWEFCRVFGWAPSSALSTEQPDRLWPTMTPVFTIVTQEGGDTFKRHRQQFIFENTLMLAGLLGMIAMITITSAVRLWRGGRLIGNDFYNQSHSGTGDNIGGSKTPGGRDDA